MSSITYVEAGPEPEPGTPISKSTFPSVCRTAVHLVSLSSRCQEPDTIKPSRDWWSPPLRARVLPLVHPGADGCRTDLPNVKSLSVSELVSPSVLDSQGGWDVLSFCLAPGHAHCPLPCCRPGPGAEPGLMTPPLRPVAVGRLTLTL